MSFLVKQFQCNISGSIGNRVVCTIKPHSDVIDLICCSHAMLSFINPLRKTCVFYSIQHLSLNLVVWCMFLDRSKWLIGILKCGNNLKIVISKYMLHTIMSQWDNKLSMRQNGHNFADNIFKCLFLNKNGQKISLKSVPSLHFWIVMGYNMQWHCCDAFIQVHRKYQSSQVNKLTAILIINPNVQW